MSETCLLSVHNALVTTSLDILWWSSSCPLWKFVVLLPNAVGLEMHLGLELFEAPSFIRV